MRGVPFPKPIRELLVYHFSILKSTAEFCYTNLFIPDTVSMRHLKTLKHRIINMTDEECGDYITGEQEHAELIPEGSDADNMIENLLSVNRCIKVRLLAKQFYEEFFPAIPDRLPSLRTVYNAVRRHNSRKKVDWTNVGKNPIEQIEFLKRVGWIQACWLVDIDGMVESADDFHARYGWGPTGEALQMAQLYIGGSKYPVHAAFTEVGFIKWVIFPPNHNVTEEDVQNFIQHISERDLPPNAVGIFDNASNQRGDDVRIAIENLFHGRYMYCPAYSPELKPIERGFALVKRWIRDNEPTWTESPIDLIHAAFHYYSSEGEGGVQAYNLFRIYRDNYEEQNTLQD